MLTDRKKWFAKGLHDGIPIMLGYFAVSIALGISARNAGMTAPQATLASALIMASGLVKRGWAQSKYWRFRKGV